MLNITISVSNISVEEGKGSGKRPKRFSDSVIVSSPMPADSPYDHQTGTGADITTSLG